MLFYCGKISGEKKSKNHYLRKCNLRVHSPGSYNHLYWAEINTKNSVAKGQTIIPL